jgi:hypothetical protein
LKVSVNKGLGDLIKREKEYGNNKPHMYKTTPESVLSNDLTYPQLVPKPQSV